MFFMFLEGKSFISITSPYFKISSFANKGFNTLLYSFNFLLPFPPNLGAKNHYLLANLSDLKLLSSTEITMRSSKRN